MKGYTGLQSMGGYDPLIVKNHSLSTSQVVAGVKQKKAVPGIKDNRQLLAEQLNLLDTIQGGKASISVAGSVVQGRIPNFTELNTLHKKLSVDVIKEKVEILLKNLQLEGKILQGDGETVDVNLLIMPDGKVDQAYYEQLFGNANGTEDKEKIYHKAKEAETELNKGDMESLSQSINTAQGYVKMTQSNTSLLENVFGSQFTKALENYGIILVKLSKLGKSIKVTTDYNGDSEQWGIGALANFGKGIEKEQSIHFLQTMCGNDAKSPITVIHECAHLSDASIKDKGYVGSPGFELMSEENKLNNAAHYEVVPWWLSGLSCPYPPATVFKESKIGENNVDQGKKQAADYFLGAHKIAFNYAKNIRGINIGTRKMTSDIVAYSKLMGLTIHLNKGCKVTLLDVTLAENIVHVLISMYKSIKENNEMIGKYNKYPPEIYKAHFKDVAFRTCHLGGVTWKQIDALNTIAIK